MSSRLPMSREVAASKCVCLGSLRALFVMLRPSVSIPAVVSPSTVRSSGLAQSVPSPLEAICSAVDRKHPRTWDLLDGIAISRGPFLRPTSPLYYRNVVAGTLADTPSGYIQDPANFPKQMVCYGSAAPGDQAALEAIEQQRELESDELAFDGYATPSVQEQKRIIFGEMSDSAALQSAVQALEGELTHILGLVGATVAKTPSPEKILELKLQQRRKSVLVRSSAFCVAPPPLPEYEVVLGDDGEDRVRLRRARNTGVEKDPYPSQNELAEDLDSALMQTDGVEVTVRDVNHVRYLLGLGYRRLSMFEDAEAMLMEILNNDIGNVDTIECLLEMYAGMSAADKIQELLDFLSKGFMREVSREGSRLFFRKNVEHAEDGSGGSGAQQSFGGNGAPLKTSADVNEGSLLEGMAHGGEVAAVHGGHTEPVPDPVELAVSLLADMVVEAAALHCAEHGEGATSRFFLRALEPFAKHLKPVYLSLLLELLFRSVDEQHFLARFGRAATANPPGSGAAASVELSPEATKLVYALVIAFLKTLLARRMDELVTDPLHFRFFILLKLHTALSSTGRKHESYVFVKQLFELYHVNSSLHRQRLAAAKMRAQEFAVSSQLSSLLGVPCRSAGNFGDLVLSHESNFSYDPLGNSHRNGDIDNGVPLNVAAPPQQSGALDDQDANYKAALFQYLNDRAHDSIVEGRRLCLLALEEFPDEGSPWETLAMLLYREDPKGKLQDAIAVAHRGLQLEPLNLGLIATCATLYLEANYHDLYKQMMDHYHLLCHMLEQHASEEDMLAVADEIRQIENARVLMDGRKDRKVEDVAEGSSGGPAGWCNKPFPESALPGVASEGIQRDMRVWDSLNLLTKAPRVLTQQPVTLPSHEITKEVLLKDISE